MPDTDSELTTLIASLLEMQTKLGELEAQQASIKQQLAATVAKADGLRSKRKKGKGESPSDTIPEYPENAIDPSRPHSS